MKFELKRIALFLVLFIISIMTQSCALVDKTKYIEDAPRDRQLVLSGKVISESELGGVERWYAIDKYGGSSKVRFQVGYFREEPNIGFVLYEGGNRGELAICYRAGLNLRWDWGNYSIVIKSDGTGLYYDFSSKTTDVPPRETFKVYKF